MSCHKPEQSTDPFLVRSVKASVNDYWNLRRTLEVLKFFADMPKGFRIIHKGVGFAKIKKAEKGL